MPTIKRYDYTPEQMSSMNADEVFGFGSNPEGRHSLGAALFARRKCGAIYGQAEGLQGRSYAIITKELRPGYPAITLDQVREGVRRFFAFAATRPDLTFYMSKIGCGLAGFAVKDVAAIFHAEWNDQLDNVVLPLEFHLTHDHA